MWQLWAYSQWATTQSNVISLPSPFSRCEKYTYQLRQITVTNFTNMRQLWVYSQWGASTQSSVIGLVFFWQPIFSWKKNKKTCLKIFYWNGLQKKLWEKFIRGGMTAKIWWSNIKPLNPDWNGNSNSSVNQNRRERVWWVMGGGRG